MDYLKTPTQEERDLFSGILEKSNKSFNKMSQEIRTEMISDFEKMVSDKKLNDEIIREHNTAF